MTKIKRTALPLLAALAGVATVNMAAVNVAQAHHAGAVFDMTKTITYSGTVRKFLWANPHSWIYITVTKANGATENWGFEGSSPNQMERAGWSYHDIKVGDKIAIDGHPAHGGDHYGMMNDVYLANGEVRGDPVGGGFPGGANAGKPLVMPTKPQGTPYQ